MLPSPEEWSAESSPTSPEDWCIVIRNDTMLPSPDAWIAKYYPVEAKDCPREKAIEHSLQKWRGLRIDALEDFGLEDPPISINDKSCALCNHYLDLVFDNCDGCPLNQYLGRVCDDHGPFNLWRLDRDPEPMIKALEGCLKESTK